MAIGNKMNHSTREDDRPSFQFYPKDWMTDIGLKQCEPEDKGIWIDLLCLMFFSPIRGALLNPDGSQMDNKTITKLLGVPEKVITNTLNKLITKRVARQLEDGTIVSWKMYSKDKDLSQKRREAGLKGMAKRWSNDKDNKSITSGITNDNKHNLPGKEKEIVIEKNKYLEYVYLSLEQFKKLEDRFGEERTQEYIERLNNYIGSKGVKYKSHYHTILNWANKDGNKGKMPDGEY